MTLLGDVTVWTTACPYDRLLPNRGVGVLLPDGVQAALFRLDDGSLRAVGNIDPFSGAAVMSRGIVGEACFGDRYETDEDMNDGNRITEEEILRLINPPRS